MDVLDLQGSQERWKNDELIQNIKVFDHPTQKIQAEKQLFKN